MVPGTSFQAARIASCTLSGSGMYSIFSAMSSPCVKPQSKNFFTAALCFGSFGSVGSRTKVAETIGQLSAPLAVVQIDSEILHRRPVRVGGRSLERLHRWRDELAILVLEQRGGQVVLLGVGAFVIADAAGDVLDSGGDAVAALAAGAVGPGDRGGRADLRLPIGADHAEVIGEHEGGARTVGTVNRGDRQGRQLHAGIDLRDLRIIPLGDVAEIDVGQHRTGQLQLVRLHAGQVDDDVDPADHGGKLHQLVFGELVGRHRHVGSAEIDRAVVDLVDARTRPDGLVVQLDAGRGRTRLAPLAVDRRAEGGAGAGYRLGLRGTRREQAGERNGNCRRGEFHATSWVAASTTARRPDARFSRTGEPPGPYAGAETRRLQFREGSMTLGNHALRSDRVLGRDAPNGTSVGRGFAKTSANS